MQKVGHKIGTHAGRLTSDGYAYRHKPACVATNSSVTPQMHPAIATQTSCRLRQVRSVCASRAAISAAHAIGQRNIRHTPPTATTVLMATCRRFVVRAEASGMTARSVA